MARVDPESSAAPDTECFICGGPLVRLPARYNGDCHACGERYALYRCSGCGLLKILPEPTAEEIVDLYPPDYYSFNIIGGTSRIARLRERLKDEALELHYGEEVEPGLLGFLARLARGYMSRVSFSGVPLHYPLYNGRFLDIGCGDGYWVRKLGRFGWDCTGVEFVGEESDRIKVGDFLEMEFEEGFEFIRLNHVLEHVKEPDAYLAKIRSCLREEGELYIGIPNAESIYFKIFGSYWHALDAPRHLHGFNEGNLNILLQRNGLQIKNVRYESRYSFGNCLITYLSARIGRELEDDQMLSGLLFSPLDAILGRIGPGDLINATAGHPA